MGMDNNMLRKIASGKCGDDNNLGYYALKSEIQELKKQYKFCDELVDELKVDGYKYLPVG